MKKRRLVSKRQYIQYLGGKTARVMIGGFALASGICIAVSIISVCIWTYTDDQDMIPPVTFHCLGAMFSLLALLWAFFGKVLIKEAIEMEVVEPITRHNIEKLPAEVSLVRASSEPAVDQEAVLLRAAQSAKQTPAEELLRASIGSRVE